MALGARIAAWCMLMVAVRSFSHPDCSSGDAATKQLQVTSQVTSATCEQADDAEPLVYGMGGEVLSQRWTELVAGGHVTAATVLNKGEGGKGLRVRYGVKLEDGPSRQQQQRRMLEFVEVLSTHEEGHDTPKLRDRVYSINATLAEMQRFAEKERGDGSARNGNGLAIRCVHDGPYAAQLQLVRTLRPPRSKDMSRNADEKLSCTPPPYDASEDSFLVGSLRLYGHGPFHGDGEPRERAVRLSVPRDGGASAHWDVFHNISPVDPRGHFLLLPAIDDEREWRDQSLSSSDCHDVTYLAATVDPPGSMVLSFNSVGAGATQNHVHCHAWVCPPPPLLERDAAVNCNAYTVAKAPAAIPPVQLPHGVSVALLEYPCTCIKLSADIDLSVQASPALVEMRQALWDIVRIAQKRQAPHNVAWTNRPRNSSDDGVAVDIYIFFREKEGSLVPGEMFRLGASELLGVFHSSSKEQLDSLARANVMHEILADVSLEPREAVWADVCKALEI